MTFATPHAALRQQASRLARSGAWGDLAALLGEPADEAPFMVAELVTLRAESLMFTGRPRDARDWLVRRIPELAHRRERAALRSCTNMLGVAHFTLGDLESARTAFERALELGHQDRDALTVARATNNLGAIANVRGAREEALAHYQLAVPAYQHLGNAIGLAQSFHNIAITFRDLAQLDRADEFERRAIEFARQGGSTPLALLARLGRAEVCLRSGDATLAEARGREAARGFAAIGDEGNEGDAWRLVGEALTAQGRHAAAGEVLDAALVRARLHGSALHEAESLRARAALRMQSGYSLGAEEDARAALEIYERLGAVTEVAALRVFVDGVAAVTARH